MSIVYSNILQHVRRGCKHDHLCDGPLYLDSPGVLHVCLPLTACRREPRCLLCGGLCGRGGLVGTRVVLVIHLILHDGLRGQLQRGRLNLWDQLLHNSTVTMTFRKHRSEYLRITWGKLYFTVTSVFCSNKWNKSKIYFLPYLETVGWDGDGLAWFGRC